MRRLDRVGPVRLHPRPQPGDDGRRPIRLHELVRHISGTIAYNIVSTDPSDGYYLFGQQGEIAGFGNDNYLVYLDGAQYYNLNAPIVGMAPTPDGAGYWMVGSDGGVFTTGTPASTARRGTCT